MTPAPQWSRKDPREALADYGSCFEVVILDGTHAERAVVYCGQGSPGVHGWGVYGETNEWGPLDAWDGWRWIRIVEVEP